MLLEVVRCHPPCSAHFTEVGDEKALLVMMTTMLIAIENSGGIIIRQILSNTRQAPILAFYKKYV